MNIGLGNSTAAIAVAKWANAIKILWHAEPVMFARPVRGMRPTVIIDLLGALLVFAIPFSYIISHFYISSPYLLDSGIFATLLSTIDPLQHLPVSLNQTSYLGTHVSPIFYLFALPAGLFSIPPPVVFATYVGLTYLIFYIAVRILIPGVGTILAALIAPGLGLLLLQILYPHTEALFCALFFLSTALYLQGYSKKYVFTAFALSLLVREDSGFHACAFGGISWLYCIFSKKPKAERNHWLLIWCIGLATSMAIMIVQKQFFATNDNALQRVYIGNPAFAHVTAALIWERLKYFGLHKAYIWIPLVTSIGFSIAKRDLIFYLGWLATSPWLFLNLLAKADSAGTLFAYYSFPLGLGILSLLIGLRRYCNALQVILVLGALLLCDVALEKQSYRNIVKDGIHLTTPFDYKKGEALLKPWAAAGAGAYANVAGLYPNLFKPAQVDDTSAPVYIGWTHQQSNPPPFLIYAHQKIFKLEAGFPFMLCLDESRVDPRLLRTLRETMQPVNNIYAWHQTKGLIVHENTAIGTASTPDRIVVWGPYVTLPKGDYEVVYHFDEIRATGTGCLTLAVTTQIGQNTVVKNDVSGPASASEHRLAFTLKEDTENVEFIVRKAGPVTFVINNITVDRRDSFGTNNASP